MHALSNQGLCLRLRAQGAAQGGSGALAGVVVRRGANTAKGENDVARSKGLLERGGDARRLVPDVIGISHRQSSRTQQGDGFGQVLVGTPTGEDFVANDDEAEIHADSFNTGWPVAPLRTTRKAARQ